MATPVLDQAHHEPTNRAPSFGKLHKRIEELESSTGARSIAVALYDQETRASFLYNGDRWFHAASTIKLAILVGVYSAIHRGMLMPDARLHVRNRFHSALDGIPFRVRADRDANTDVQACIGKTMRISELAFHMIVTSSNLAANLLLDLVGLEEVHSALDRLQIHGVDVLRGVEDDRAWEAGMNNRVTAEGLVRLLRVIAEGEAFSPEICQQMMDILHSQHFKTGIPAKLPKEVRVAHKTGEISTIAHDAGVIFVPGRQPYILAVLTEWPADVKGRSQTIALISREVFEALTGNVANA